MIPYLTAEQRDLRNAVRRLLERKSPLSEARRLMATDEGYDRALWSQMAAQLGLQGLGVDEELGGSGRTYVELTLVLEEMGYALTCSPFLSNAVATAALQLAGSTPAGQAAVRSAVAGERISTLCIAGADGTWSGSGADIVATGSEAAGWTLTGSSRHVLDGHVADDLVVVATVHGRAALFLVDARAAGVGRRLRPTLDQTRKLADVQFDGAPAQLVSAVGAEPVVSHVLDLAAVLLAAEQLGGARRILDMAVAYAGTRVQFGRLIGSFQAIKHRCADMLVAVEGARSLVFYASRLAGNDDDGVELAAVASMTKSYCSDAYFEVASDAIQIHGGIGFTWEHDAHLFFKRATASRLMFGDSATHRDQLVERLGMAR